MGHPLDLMRRRFSLAVAAESAQLKFSPLRSLLRQSQASSAADGFRMLMVALLISGFAQKPMLSMKPKVT